MGVRGCHHEIRHWLQCTVLCVDQGDIVYCWDRAQISKEKIKATATSLCSQLCFPVMRFDVSANRLKQAFTNVTDNILLVDVQKVQISFFYCLERSKLACSLIPSPLAQNPVWLQQHPVWKAPSPFACVTWGLSPVCVFPSEDSENRCIAHEFTAKHCTVLGNEWKYAETQLFVIVQFGSLLYKGQWDIYVAFGNSVGNLISVS